MTPSIRLITATILILSWMVCPAWACYAIIVGREASADGSVLVAHAEQNGGRRILNFRKIPQQEFSPDSTVTLRRNGSLPQVEQTAAFLWSENPGMEFSDAYLNEWGVAVVSDGCPTREDDYETLIRRGDIRDGGIGYMLRRLVAQRAHTARERVAFADQRKVEDEALKLWTTDQQAARALLTNYSARLAAAACQQADRLTDELSSSAP